MQKDLKTKLSQRVWENMKSYRENKKVEKVAAPYFQLNISGAVPLLVVELKNRTTV